MTDKHRKGRLYTILPDEYMVAKTLLHDFLDRCVAAYPRPIIVAPLKSRDGSDYTTTVDVLLDDRLEKWFNEWFIEGKVSEE